MNVGLVIGCPYCCVKEGHAEGCPNKPPALEQWQKCQRGEHEVDLEVRIGAVLPQGNTLVYKRLGGQWKQLGACKYCRCLYVEK